MDVLKEKRPSSLNLWSKLTYSISKSQKKKKEKEKSSVNGRSVLYRVINVFGFIRFIIIIIKL